jgi:hypothetical protein
VSDVGALRGRAVGRAVPGLRFARHFGEMAVAMMVGMMAGGLIFFGATGLAAADAMRQHAVAFVVVQAIAMSAAMVAWMRYRGHTWNGCWVMTLAMVIPAAPLVALRLADVISGPICGLYCLATYLAMLAVMLYRRNEYRGSHRA